MWEGPTRVYSGVGEENKRMGRGMLIWYGTIREERKSSGDLKVTHRIRGKIDKSQIEKIRPYLCRNLVEKSKR